MCVCACICNMSQIPSEEIYLVEYTFFTHCWELIDPYSVSWEILNKLPLLSLSKLCETRVCLDYSISYFWMVYLKSKKLKHKSSGRCIVCCFFVLFYFVLVLVLLLSFLSLSPTFLSYLFRKPPWWRPKIVIITQEITV